MKVASTVILLAEAAVAAIADALIPSSDSAFTRDVSKFEISLEKYGIKDGKATGDVVQFLDPHGSPQVSVFVLPNYETPIAACAAHQILELIASENSSQQPTLIVPYMIQTTSSTQEASDGSIYASEIGGKTELTKAIISGTSALPLFPIQCETIACLVHMVRVLKLPTALLVSSSRSRASSTSSDQLEAVLQVGCFLAQRVGLCFSTDKIHPKRDGEARKRRELWRELYG